VAEQQHPADAWRPQPGPQTTFATTPADFAIFGGSPGGGKTVACLYEGAKLCNLPGARRVRATFFRRDEVSLTRAGSIWDRAREMLPAFGGSVRLEDRAVTFEHADGQIEDQHRIDFAHLHLVGSERSYDGSEQDLIVLEELQEFEASQVWYMISRLRTRSGLRTRVRASCNPDPDCEWLVELLAGGGYIGDDGYAVPERSGVVRWIVRDEGTDELLWYNSRDEALDEHPDLGPDEVLSFTFILSRLVDNRELARKDPSYRGKLRMQLRKDRVRLIGEGPVDRGGCWFSTDVAGDFFALDAIKIRSEPPSPIVRRVRGWDFGSSEPTSKEPDPDWTEGALVAICENGELWIEDLESAQLGPLATTQLVLKRAGLDGPLVEVAIFQDTGAAGKRDAATIAAELERGRLTVHVVHSDRRQGDEKGSPEAGGATRRRGTKRTKSSPAKQAMARPWSLLASQGRVFMKGPAEWNRKVITQTHRFPNARKDDAIDGISCAVHVLTEGGTTVADALETLERQDRRRSAKAPAPKPKNDRARYEGIELINLEDIDND
jgi:phage terminase large subunit-like protein